MLFHLYAHRKSCLHPGDCLWISEASPFLDVTAHHPEQQQQLPDLTQFLSTCSVYTTLKQGSSRSRTMGLSALHRQVSDALAVHEELARCVGCSGLVGQTRRCYLHFHFPICVPDPDYPHVSRGHEEPGFLFPVDHHSCS